MRFGGRFQGGRFGAGRFIAGRFSGAEAAPGVPAAPSNTGLPVISPSGESPAGTVLSVSPGFWSGYPSPAFSYAWKRDGSPIGGAIAASYTTQAADIGAEITCTVTATNSEGSAEATSAAVTVSAAPSGAFSTAFSSAFDRAA